MMKRIPRYAALLLCGLLLSPPLAAAADLEWNVLATLDLGRSPLDLVVNPSDGRTLVLLDNGEIQIFSATGQPEERINVPGAASLTLTPDGQRLLVGNRDKKQLQIIEMAYIHQLPVGDSPVKGPADAPLTLTVFDDFQCPYCARLVPLIAQVQATYPEQLRIVFKNFPLRMHKFAEDAALAGLAAHRQGKFWPLHDQLFANYNTLTKEKIRNLAENVGLDMPRFDRDLTDPALEQEIQGDMRLGQQVGVRGTPSLFLNGKLVKDRSSQGLNLEIQRELARLKRQ